MDPGELLRERESLREMDPGELLRERESLRMGSECLRCVAGNWMTTGRISAQTSLPREHSSIYARVAGIRFGRFAAIRVLAAVHQDPSRK
jgi:hypothetical protein